MVVPLSNTAYETEHTQVVRSAEELLSAGQSVQSAIVSPPALLYVPSGHSTHVSVLSKYWPAGHAARRRAVAARLCVRMQRGSGVS